VAFVKYVVVAPTVQPFSSCTVRVTVYFPADA